jgi:hypothetical protein
MMLTGEAPNLPQLGRKDTKRENLFVSIVIRPSTAEYFRQRIGTRSCRAVCLHPVEHIRIERIHRSLFFLFDVFSIGQSNAFYDQVRHIGIYKVAVVLYKLCGGASDDGLRPSADFFRIPPDYLLQRRDGGIIQAAINGFGRIFAVGRFRLSDVYLRQLGGIFFQRLCADFKTRTDDASLKNSVLVNEVYGNGRAEISNDTASSTTS